MSVVMGGAARLRRTGSADEEKQGWMRQTKISEVFRRRAAYLIRIARARWVNGIFGGLLWIFGFANQAVKQNSRDLWKTGNQMEYTAYIYLEYTLYT
jgi:hypothetical protein